MIHLSNFRCIFGGFGGERSGEEGEGKGHIDERMCLRLNEKILGKKDKRWWEKRKKTKKI